MRLVRLLWILCISILCFGCLLAVTNEPPPPDQPKLQKEKNDTVTIFLTGNTLGKLKPCGCASGQLGGMDRRPAVLNEVPHDRRLLIDTGNLIASETQQNIIKLDIIIQALLMLNYDLMALTENDFRIVNTLGMIESIPFDIISYVSDDDIKTSAKYTRRVQTDNYNLSVNVATIDTESKKMEFVKKLFENDSPDPSLNILIVNSCENNVTDYIADLNVVDVIICPSATEEPEVLNKKIKQKPLIITTGKLGRYIGKLTAELLPDGKPKLNYTSIAVEEKLPQDPDLIELYREYQLIVKEEGLLEKTARVPLPDGQEYLGSKNCSTCHEYEYEKWSTKAHAHAHAYRTLVEVGSQYDPECIKCHVVGFEYETGFTSEKSPESLRDVGCEVCHGPGSAHVTEEKNTKTTEPRQTCIDCHTPEHSNYQGHEEEFMKKIIHWREPMHDTNVKK